METQLARPSERLRPVGAARPRLATNTLLRQMGAEAASRIIPVSRRIDLRLGEQVLPAPMQDIYLPLSGAVSVRQRTSKGDVETDVVGPEGAVGLAESFAHAGAWDSLYRANLRGHGLLVSRAVMHTVIDSDNQAAAAVRRYPARSLLQSRAVVTCRSIHPLRLCVADALLSYSHRVERSSAVPITQDTLAKNLAACRTTVTSVIAALAGEGLIKVGRGALRVLDEQGLDAVACGCRRASAIHRAEQPPSVPGLQS